MNNAKIIISIVLVLNATHVKCESLTRGAFEAMSADDRMSFVITVLADRDDRLSNIRYRVVETETGRRKRDGAVRLLTKNAYDFRRCGITCWIHERQYQFGSADKVREEFALNWDGHVNRRIAFPPYYGTAKAQCRIESKESTFFAIHRFGELLGFRFQDGKTTYQMAEWAKAMAQFGRAKASFRDDRAIRLTVDSDNFRHYEIDLQVDRDFMISRIERVLMGGAGRAITRVVAAEPVNGVWIPVRAIRQTDNQTDDQTGETTYDISGISLQTTHSADVALAFPPGSLVLDVVKGIYYEILPDSTLRLLPYANSEERAVHIPQLGKKHVASDREAASHYKTLPLVYSVSPSPLPSRASKVFRWSIIVISLAALAALIWVRRSPPTRRPSRPN